MDRKTNMLDCQFIKLFEFLILFPLPLAHGIGITATETPFPLHYEEANTEVTGLGPPIC